MEFHLKMVTHLANYLDNKFVFMGKRFGVSALIDLIPGIGDFLDVGLSLYLVWIATRLKLPDEVIARMIFNVVISFIIGLIPVFGDISYIFYRPNLRNLRLLQKYTGNSDGVLEGQVISHGAKA